MIKKFRKNTFNYVFIFISLVLGFVFYTVHLKVVEFSKESLFEKFQLSQNKAFTLFEDKLNGYVYGLQGIGGVFRSIDFKYSPRKMREYAESRNFFKNFEGALGYGIIRSVKDQKEYLKKIRKQSPEFKIKNLNEHNNQFKIIETIEPLERNRPAIGLNIASEKFRNEAAELAIDLKNPIITKEIKLVQDNKESIGYLIYLPIYKTSNIKKIISPRDDFVAFAYAPVLADGIVDYLKKRIDFNFHLNIYQENSSKVFFSNGKKLNNDLKVEFKKKILGRVWTWEASQNSADDLKSIVILSGTAHILLFLLLSYFVYRYLVTLETVDEQLDKNFNLEYWQHTVLNSTDFSIISTDKDGIIKTFNKGAEKILGYSADEVIDRESPALFHDMNEVIAKAYALTIELGEEIKPGFEVFVTKANRGLTDINEWTYLHKNGTKKIVRLIVTTLRNKKHEIFGYLGIAEDISEVKELQHLIEEQKLKMVESARLSALGEMASSIAHEVNNPITAINSLILMTTKKIVRNEISLGEIPAELSKLNNLAIRVSKIVSGLKTLSRNSSQDPFIKFSIKDAIDDALTICSQRLNNQEIHLILDLGVDELVLMRPTQISQVILNLLNNSHDAISNCQNKWIKVLTSIDNNMLYIRIIDSGNGIREDVLNKMMEPFYTTKEFGKGTGLGLSISKSIIESHNGKFYYELYNGNTSFVIVLPKA